MQKDQLNDVLRGIERDEFIPYFQPIVELRSGMLTGFEILARWRHPERGIIPPDEFIPITEQGKSIGALTERLLYSAFASASKIPAHLSLSINISPTQLHTASLLEHIQQAARSEHFSLNRLIVEITESTLASNLDRARKTAYALKDLGVRLALDDFGTGFSSLVHLQALPFDEIKVDAGFVHSMTRDRDSRKIAAAIIGLGHSLGLTTVAEGIEEQEHADRLLWLGCELGQGWYYGRAVPAEELAQFDSAHPIGPPAGMPVKDWDRDATIQLEALPGQRIAQLEALYNGTQVGLCFLDRNLRYTSINKRFAEINRLPVTYHLGRTVAEILPDIYPALEPYLQRALQGEAITGFEISNSELTHGADRRRFMVSYQPVRDEAGEVIGISVSAIDITDRSLAEEALKESEEHYRFAVELNPQVAWTADPNGMILDFGPVWTTLTGMTRQETLGTGWLDALHPDDVALISNKWQQAVLTGTPVDTEYRIGRKHGNYRWMRARAAPRFGPDGKIIRWYGTVEDIDDRKKTEQALRSSQARLQAVFLAAPVGLVIAESPSGRITMRNPEAQRILGPPTSEIDTIENYRKRVAYRPDGTRFEPHEYPLARAVLHGETTPPESMLYERSDGTQIWVRVQAAPIVEPNGKITGGVLSIQEILPNQENSLNLP